MSRPDKGRGNPDTEANRTNEPSSHDFREALAEIECYSLVARASDTQAFGIHRLVQEVTRRSQAGDAAVPGALVDSLQWIDAAFAGDPMDVRNWPVLAPLASHAQAVAAHADTAGIIEVTATLLNRDGHKMTDVPVQATQGKPFQIDFILSSLAAGQYVIQIDAKNGSGTAQQLIGFKVGT